MRIISRVHRSTILALSLFGLLCCAPMAFAQDVWRLAGTMNGWNPDDASWSLSEGDGVLVLERRIEPGNYSFKFVRNADWNSGHFGGAGDGTLEQPGRDLVMEVRAPGVYRIELDLAGERWSWRPLRIDEPLLEAVVRGRPTLGEAFLVDLRRSVFSVTEEGVGIEVAVEAGSAKVERVDDLLFAVTPETIGALTLRVMLDDGFDTRVRTVVGDAWSYDVEFEAGAGSFNLRTPMEAVEPGVLRGLVWIKRPGTLETLRVLRSGEVVASMAGPVRIEEAGRFAVEVREDATGKGRVTRITPAGDLPDFLLPGGWTEFAYTPAPGQDVPARVHLTGTFNRWASANSGEAVELASVATGGFRTLVDLPEGAHRYGYLLDGERFVPDANNPDSARTVRDELVSVVVVGPTPDQFPVPRPGRLYFDGIRHDPTRPGDFTPISRGLGLAEISFTTLPDDAEGASVLVDVEDDKGNTRRIMVACRRERDDAGFDRYTARVMTGRPTVTYCIALSDGPEQYIGPDFTVDLPEDPLQSPDWAKGAVWYQIFAERFRNGNPLNDPHGAHVYQPDWTDDWYSVTEEELEAHRLRYGRAKDEPLEPRTGGDLFHVVWDRRYGGDLQGVVEKLDYLKDLGVTAIYFNPVFEGTSMHKYDATDFRHIDDNFGTPEEAGRVPERFEWPSDPTKELDDPGRRTWSAADRYFIDVLLPEAKRRDIRVVIDGVWNHTGRDHFAFQDVVEKGTRSAFRDWFFTEYDENGKLVAWRAWDGPSGWLPKFTQTANRDLVQPVKDHIFAVTERWMDPDGDGDPSDGVDGWRLDVPLDIGLPFWVDWRTHVKSINPDAIIIAEIWSDARDTLRGEHFDTQMHYPFAMPVVDWLAVDPSKRSDQLADDLTVAFDEALQTRLIHQNLFGSHDTDRFVSMLYNPGRNYDQANRIQDGAPYRDTRPDDRTYELSLLGVAIQATYEGAPMVYYGDELGMWGADDPTDRKPMAWPDVGPFENPDDGPDLSIHAEYRRWLSLRHDPVIGPVLRYGDVEHLESGSPDVFAFQRSLNDATVRVVVNRGEAPYRLRRLDREGLAPQQTLGAREAVYWVIEHDALVRE
ncbi:MAG: hypothetical protein Tsb0013_02180 [Phycisphaerales bacterium]